MATIDLAGATIEVDAEGFLVNRGDWNKQIAEEIARQESIELTSRHWEVIEFMRQDFEAEGSAPSIRRLKKLGVVPTKELYALFPGGPAKKASKIAGLPKPKGCV